MSTVNKYKISQGTFLVPKGNSNAIVQQMMGDHEVCLIPKQKWTSITKWLVSKTEEDEERKKHQTHWEYMKDLSTKLLEGQGYRKETSSRRLETKHRLELQAREDKLFEDCANIEKNRKEERDEIIKKHRRLALISRSPTVEITSALRHSETLYVRQKQIEFNEKIKRDENELGKRELEQLKRQAEAADIAQKQEEQARISKAKELSSFLWNQYQENERRKKLERSERIAEERADIAYMENELQKVETLQQEIKLSRQKESRLRKDAQYAHVQRMLRKKEEEEINKINEIIRNAGDIRDNRIKAQLKKEVEDKVNRNLNDFVKYQSQIPSTALHEEKIYQNALRQKEDEYKKSVKDRMAFQKSQAEDRVRNYQEDMRRQKEKEDEEAELARMEMAERYKKAEDMKYMEEVIKKEEMDKIKMYRQELLNQQAEIEESKEHEKKLENEYIMNSFKAQDDQFQEYSAEVLKFATDKGWPTIPIERAIADYKKRNSLVPSIRK